MKGSYSLQHLLNLIQKTLLVSYNNEKDLCTKLRKKMLAGSGFSSYSYNRLKHAPSLLWWRKHSHKELEALDHQKHWLSYEAVCSD